MATKNNVRSKLPNPHDLDGFIGGGYIEKAIEDYNDGIDHPYGQARTIFLIIDGDRYDSKPIVGLALWHYENRDKRQVEHTPILGIYDIPAGMGRGEVGWFLQKAGYEVEHNKTEKRVIEEVDESPVEQGFVELEQEEFSALGKKVDKFEKFDPIPTPEFVTQVVMTSDEVTALCPKTKQPDWYTVTITYKPAEKCIESKTLKLYLHSLRDVGMFVEALSSKILKDVVAAISPLSAKVEIIQKARGGVSIIATAEWSIAAKGSTNED